MLECIATIRYPYRWLCPYIDSVDSTLFAMIGSLAFFVLDQMLMIRVQCRISMREIKMIRGNSLKCTYCTSKLTLLLHQWLCHVECNSWVLSPRDPRPYWRQKNSWIFTVTSKCLLCDGKLYRKLCNFQKAETTVNSSLIILKLTSRERRPCVVWRSTVSVPDNV